MKSSTLGVPFTNSWPFFTCWRSRQSHGQAHLRLQPASDASTEAVQEGSAWQP